MHYSHLIDKLPSGGVADEKVAAQLNMSERSHQRRLNEVGTAFRTLLEGVLKDLASTYVSDPDNRVGRRRPSAGFLRSKRFLEGFQAVDRLLSKRGPVSGKKRGLTS